MVKKFIIFYPIITGLLLSLAYNYPVFWFLGLFSLWPFIYFLYNVNQAKKIFINSLIFGFVFMGFSVIWLWASYPLDWAGVSNNLLGWLAVLLHWGIIVVLGFFIALFGLSFYVLKSRNWTDILLFPSLWVIFEFLRAWFYSILIIAPESLIGPFFTFGFLGHLLALNSNLLQLASIGGIYFLSFIVVFINIFFYWLIFIKKGKKKIMYLFSSLFLLLFLMFFSFNIVFDNAYKDNLEIKVSVMHTKLNSFFEISNEDAKKRLNVYYDLLKELQDKEEKPDMLIFPEDSRFLRDLIKEKNDYEFFNNIFGEKDVLIIDSSRVRDDSSKLKSRLFYYSPRQGVLDKYDKIFLTPGGEYNLSIVISLMKLLGQDDFLGVFDNNRAYSKGSELSIGQFNGYGVGTLFCNEIFSPDLYRKITLKGSNVLINVASQSIFKGNQILYNQTRSIAKIRAVENNRYFIQAGNFISSSIIDNKGNVIAVSDDNNSLLHGKILLIKDKTLYNLFGDWILIFSLLVVIYLFFSCLKRNK